jgi:Tfp pilus assembly protein FimT
MGAFTLVDLLLSVVLISVLVGSVAVALHRRRDPYVVESAAEDLAAALRLAAGQAEATGQPHRVAWSDDGSSFRVERWRTASMEFEPLAGMAGRFRPLGSGVQVAAVRTDRTDGTSQKPELSFDGRGEGFSGRIELRGGQRWVDIEVHWRSGQVLVRGR